MLLSTTQTHVTFEQLSNANLKSVDDNPHPKHKRKLSTESETSSIFPKSVLYHSDDCTTIINTNCKNIDCNNSNAIGNDSMHSYEKRPRFSISHLLSASFENDNDIASTSNGSGCSLADDDFQRSTTLNGDNNFIENSPSNATVKLKEVQLRKLTKHSKRFIRPKSIVIPLNYVPNGNSSQLTNIRCILEPDNKQLWTRFDKIGTEMIITKPGRRMFPMIKARLENCEPDAHYYVYLDAVPVDADRYRYVYEKSAWCSSGKADRTPPNRLLVHPDSPFTGAAAAVHTISFEKAKLTNSESNRHGMLILNSMHRYQPRLHVLRRDRALPPLANGGQGVDLRAKEFCGHYRTFQFGETQFMAVTAYQNQLVTEMKIGTNPFAKGFRDHGNRRDPTNEFMDVAAIGGGTMQRNLNNQSSSQPYPLDPTTATTIASTVNSSARAQHFAAAAYAAASALFPPNVFGAVAGASAGERLAAMVAATRGVPFSPMFARQQLNNYFQQQHDQHDQQQQQTKGPFDGHLNFKFVGNELENNIFGTTSEGPIETKGDPDLNTVEEEPLIDVDITVDENEEVDVDDTVRPDTAAFVAKLRELSQIDSIGPKLGVEQQNRKSPQSDEQQLQSSRRKCAKPSRKCKSKAEKA